MEELVDQTYIEQIKIQFNNVRLFQGTDTKRCISNVLERSPHEQKVLENAFHNR